MRKKGAAHFEMIISFTFFIGFIFFLFMMLSPQDSNPLFSSVIVSIQDDFMDVTGVSLGSVFMKVNHTDSPPSCTSLDFSDVFVSNYSDANSLVLDLAGNELNSSFDGEWFNIDSGDEFFNVYFSIVFASGSAIGCVDEDNYVLGSVIERDVVSYSKLNATRDKYFSNYSGLKDDLRIPAIFDFAIVPYNLTGLEMLPLSGVPEGVEILARDGVFEVLRDDGSLSSQRISFRIW